MQFSDEENWTATGRGWRVRRAGTRIESAFDGREDSSDIRVPAQTASLDMIYQQYLFSNGLLETDPGVAVGARAAAGAARHAAVRR
jgi:hypothetical protein